MGELKVWRQAAAYTKANSYFPCFFLTFSAYGYSSLLILTYIPAASKIQIRIEATSVPEKEATSFAVKILDQLENLREHMMVP